MNRRFAGCVLAVGLILLATPASATRLPVAVERAGGAERLLAELGGVLVAALSPERSPGVDGLYLLVRPARDAAGARELLRLRLAPEPRLDRVASGLDGGLDRLVALELGDPASAHLVAAGRGRLVDLGALAGLESADELVARPLAVDARFDPSSMLAPVLRRGVERTLAGVEPGILRTWSAAGERTIELPSAVTRTGRGLRLTSPPVERISTADAIPTYLVGPEKVGSTRLRFLRRSDGAPSELWASLPGPESVAQSWAFEIDGVPVVVVRTQGADELNLFEKQRLRVLTPVADRTRAGAAPTLAVEIDSKRWHSTAVALADVDVDGHDDLLAAFPEGLSGADLVVQWWRGLGRGKFAPKPRRSDLDEPKGNWGLIADGAAPGLLLAGERTVEWRPFASQGRAALVDRAELAATLPPTPGVAASAGARQKSVKVSVGSEEPTAEVTEEEISSEPLGAAELDGRTGGELVAIQANGRGDERLIVLRRAP